MDRRLFVSALAASAVACTTPTEGPGPDNSLKGALGGSIDLNDLVMASVVDMEQEERARRKQPSDNFYFPATGTKETTNTKESNSPFYGQPGLVKDFDYEDRGSIPRAGKAIGVGKTDCSTTMWECVVRTLIKAQQRGDDVYRRLPIKDLKTLRKWIVRQDDVLKMPFELPTRIKTRAPVGPVDAFIIAGIGEAVPFERAKPGDFIQFHRLDTLGKQTYAKGHNTVFVSFLVKRQGGQIEELVSLSDDLIGPSRRSVVGFKFFSSQGSTLGRNYREAYFAGELPSGRIGDNNIPDMRKHFSNDPKSIFNYRDFYGFSVARLAHPSLWYTTRLEAGETLAMRESRMSAIENGRTTILEIMKDNSLLRSVLPPRFYPASTATFASMAKSKYEIQRLADEYERRRNEDDNLDYVGSYSYSDN